MQHDPTTHQATATGKAASAPADTATPHAEMDHSAHAATSAADAPVDHAAMGHGAGGAAMTMDHAAMGHSATAHADMGMTHTAGMSMAGIPNSLYYSSIVIVMLISVAVLELTRRRAHAVAGGFRFDLMAFGPMKAAVKSRATQVSVQMFLLLTFALVIAAGFYGNQMPTKNIAPTLTWNIWWIGLIFLILFVGKVWCYACPWDGLTSWLRRLSFRAGKEETFNLGWKWPKALRNIYPATILFVGLTWLELGYHVTMSPRATATLGLMMIGLVFIPGLLFEKKSFCRYGCLIGRVSGLYAMFSPVEVRRRDAEVCASCKTADCYVGNGSGYACPTGQYLKTMDTNTYCTMCAECTRTCKHDNVAVNLRPFGTDLLSTAKPRKDEAYLALVLFSLTAFHGLTMTPSWKIFVSATQDAIGVGQLAAFSVGMTICLALPIVIYAGFVVVSRALVRAKEHSVGELFVTYSYGLIPIALFYHIAHNVEHFVMESRKLTALISDPFGYDWDLFGTAAMRAGPIFSLSTVWYLQVALIVIGHVFGIYVSHRQADRLFGSRSGTLLSQTPMILLMIGFSVLSLWLVKQPMEMRTAM
ncbi:4Fe-4S binding protein [Candidatus Poribacteria bacterium]|jgi:polyferredoxin|nr:4Fe-4S binding protein [Candidatus Poribacteria bacterium]MBT5714288.1 4Fe-4S binding protein [Candidatus Poribacteria bacterium]MBT7099721.1 4Fe-4S binding protein [Candidatus Poribacteria bacterium]MBT7809621.1 4Fe-4S binding protein [Candidatus Poribacteria bacterium]